MFNVFPPRRCFAVALVLAALTFSSSACFFRPDVGENGSGASGGSHPNTGGRTGAGGTITATGGSNPQTDCVGLECQQSTCTRGKCTVKACAGGGRTTMTGTVYDPAGKNPLSNVTVYIPNKALDPIADGPSCDPCNPVNGTSLVSGQPVALTKTNTAGHFTLGMSPDGDVPAGADIPLVVQVGKWRREVKIATVTACEVNTLDPGLTRLPHDQSEGHIPKIALTTGQLDALECLLRKVGIADSEFTPETGPGRVNFYAGGGGPEAYDPSLNGGAAITPARPWWDSLDNLKKYDIVLHSCEGSYGAFDTGSEPMSTKSEAARQALQDFADMGGRVFASHWHVYWFERGPAAFKSIATFNHRTGLPNPYDATIDTGTPSGEALSEWLVNVGGSTTPGMLTIRQNASNRTVDAVAGSNISQRWIYADTLNPKSVAYLSATTPIPGGTCGRVVFSDLHVSSGAGGTNTDQPAKPFPSGCVTTTLTPQELVLEYMLFDIASCVVPIVP